MNVCCKLFSQARHQVIPDIGYTFFRSWQESTGSKVKFPGVTLFWACGGVVSCKAANF